MSGEWYRLIWASSFVDVDTDVKTATDNASTYDLL